MASCSRLLVVAIDFGTTYSGYAYSFVDAYRRDPLDVKTLLVKTEYGQVAKVPTSVLFTPQQKFHSFGVEAEETYAQMSQNDQKKAKEWYYFEHFKMRLYKNPSLSRDMKLLDKTGRKSMPALTVFAAAITYMKRQVTEVLRKQRTRVESSDITWVLTLPAIWEDQAKQFMREAAKKAEIPEEQLVLALEPESASLYCLEFCKAQQTMTKPFSLCKGGKFMLVDCGGGTIDISAFEVTAEGELEHLHKPEGTANGGAAVDKAFKDFLIEAVGFDGITAFEPLEMLQLFRSLEDTKRSFTLSSERAHIEIPQGVVESLSISIQGSAKDSKEASIVQRRLGLDGALFKSFYQGSTDGITAAIGHVLDSEQVGHVDAIFLAGGFSESDVIQDAVCKAFPDEHVVTARSISESAGNRYIFSPACAVLMGAVMYGHNPEIITTRVSAFTYGVDSYSIFEDGTHDESRLKIDADGTRRCRDCFNVHICVDQRVKLNTLLPYKTYYPSRENQTEMTFNVFRTSKKNPLYVDEDGSRRIGTMTVLMPLSQTPQERKVEAAMMAGGTELKLMARDTRTLKEFTTTCDFLSKN